jgi:hypothetical protein
MKKHFFGFLLLISLLIPATSLAVSPILPDIHIDVPIFQAPRILTCSIDGTVKRVNLLNEVSYKVQYTSNYSQMNVPYTVYGTADRVTTNLTLYQASGLVFVEKGQADLSLLGNGQNTFTFPIKDNPGITLRASVNGIQCASKYLKTIPAAILPIQPTLDLSNIQINTSSLSVTTSFSIPLQNQTCKMLIEAAPIDTDSILIGGAIAFKNIKVGQYPYTVRGYRSDSPNNVTKYTGIYNAKLDTASGLAFGQEGKAFLFTYDSKVSTDSYIITATLGNVDCSAVVFPSHVSAVNQNSGSGVPAGDSSSSSSVNGNIGENGGIMDNDPSSDPSTTDVNGVVAVGISQEDRVSGESLQLLAKTGDTLALAVAPKVQSYEGDTVQRWTPRDSIIVGLLVAILASVVSYIVLKYRGLI